MRATRRCTCGRIIQAYGADKDDISTAKANWDSLGELGQPSWSCHGCSSTLNPALSRPFANAVPTSLPVPGATAAPTEAAGTGGASKLMPFLGVMCLVTLLLGGAIALYFYLQNRKFAGTGEKTAAQQALEAARQAEWTDYSAAGEESPHGPVHGLLPPGR